VVPFGRLFGTLGGHIRSRSVAQFGCHIRVIRYLVRNCFGSNIALVQHGSSSFDLSSLSGAFAGILDVRRMLGELIVSNRGVRSLGLLRFVDSSVGELAIT
jgi:hypothetical protein